MLRTHKRKHDIERSIVEQPLTAWRNGAFRRGGRDRKSQPSIPARWPIYRIEFAVSFDVQVE